MKIISLAFKNINSLKGEHKPIRFDENPLSDAGIFAITGPTGSGKSTILDVITLALYNRIPRFDGQISKNQISNLGSIVTHFTNDAFAKVIYEVKGNRFTSEWSVRKNRNGNFNDYEMYLYDVNGTPLNSRKTEVPVKNEEIIGLNYDQFIKSIILSQGEFAKFLKADKNERGKLLEDITGSSLYRTIGQKVFEKHKELNNLLKQKKEIIANIDILDQETIDSLKNQIKSFEEQKTELDQKVKTLAEVKVVKQALHNARKDIEMINLAADRLKKEQDDFKPLQEKLDLYSKISPLSGDIAIHVQAANNLKSTEKNLDEYHKVLKEAENKLADSILQLSELTNQNVEESNFLSVMSSFEKEVIKLDNALENLKTKGKEIRERINIQKVNLKFSINPQPDLAIEQLNKRKAQLNEHLKAASINKHTDIHECRSKLKEEKANVGILQKILAHEIDLEEAKKKIEEAEIQITKKLVKIESDKPLITKTQQLLKSRDEQISSLRTQKEAALVIASLEDHRHTLVDGEPCPLCGAVEHPYAYESPKLEPSEIDKKIKKLLLEIERETKELEQLSSSVTRNETENNLLQDHINEYKSKLIVSRDQLLLLKKDYPVKDHLKVSHDDLTNLVKELEHKNSLLETAIGALEEIKIIALILPEYADIERVMHQFKELEQKRKAKYEGRNISEVMNPLQDIFTGSKEKSIELKEAVRKETMDLERAKKLLVNIDKRLQPKMKELGFQSIIELKENLLEEDTVRTIHQKRDSINHKITENKTSLENAQKRLKENVNKDTLPDRTLDQIISTLNEQLRNQADVSQKIGEHKEKINYNSKQQLKREKQLEEIVAKEKDLEKWALLNSYIGDANGHKFSNFAQGLTLQNLLVLANRRLKNLSDRYLLDKPKNDDTLRVIDLYQGNTDRAVSTLSGGETFLISLALALSLSDMASKNIALNSLFIDEGFGSLDQETLDLAMTTLEVLQNESQKTLGIISHVEAIKERINVQIQLEKNAQGYSTVNIIS